MEKITEIDGVKRVTDDWLEMITHNYERMDYFGHNELEMCLAAKELLEYRRGKIASENRLTAKVVLDYQRGAKSLTAKEWKARARELRDKYNLETIDAIDILNNRNIMKILAKYDN